MRCQKETRVNQMYGPEDDKPNPLVGHKEQLEEKLTEQPVIKHIQRQLRKALRSQE